MIHDLTVVQAKDGKVICVCPKCYLWIAKEWCAGVSDWQN